MSQTPFRIVFAIYPGMTQLDFTGPYQFLKRWTGAEVIIASLNGGDVTADGLVFAQTLKLAEIEACDLLCVPGGTNALDVALDEDFIAQISRLATSARYITSVCTGSLILGAAGLLKGRRVACHWAWRELLPLFGAIPESGRVVRDGNLITGGGVTAGIDFALTLLAELAGADVAQTIQLGLEYAPAPPFHSGRPEDAPADILSAYQAQIGPLATKRRAQAQDAAARLAALT